MQGTATTHTPCNLYSNTIQRQPLLNHKLWPYIIPRYSIPGIAKGFVSLLRSARPALSTPTSGRGTLSSDSRAAETCSYSSTTLHAFMERCLILLIDIITINLLHWTRGLPENLTDPQPVRRFPAFYGTRWFITAFTRICHLSLSWARSIQSMPPSIPLLGRSILVFRHL
jgi:hypothetical protein